MDVDKPKKTKFSDIPFDKGIARFFGNREFVRTFWKLVMPSVVWGMVTSIVPIFFNLFSSIYFGAKSDLFSAVNYTYDILFTVNFLVVSLLFAVFPAIGNFMGYKKYDEYRQTARFALYIGLACCTILFIFEEALPTQFAGHLISASKSDAGNLIFLESHLVRIMSLISYGFLWMWIYIPSLSTVKNTTIMLYSAVIAATFFFIADPVYLHVLTHNKTIDIGLETSATNGIGGIYVVYFMIQPIIVYIYLKFVNKFKYAEFMIKFAFIKAFTSKKNSDKIAALNAEKSTILDSYFAERELLLFDKWYVTGSLLKQVCKLSWGNIIDQFFFNSFTILHTIMSTNFGGNLIVDGGVQWAGGTAPALNSADNLAAGKTFYHLIYGIPAELISFFYGIFRAFTVAPQYLVSRELGKGNALIGRRNAFLCINWSIAIGATFMIFLMIFASFSPQVTMPSDGQEYKTLAGGAEIKFTTLYTYARNLMLLFAFVIMIDTISNMTLYVALQGASKYMILADALFELIFTIIGMVLHFTHFNNYFLYFLIPHSNRFFQLIAYLILLFTGVCFNSIHTIEKSDKKKASKETPKDDEPYIVVVKGDKVDKIPAEALKETELLSI